MCAFHIGWYRNIETFCKLNNFGSALVESGMTCMYSSFFDGSGAIILSPRRLSRKSGHFGVEADSLHNGLRCNWRNAEFRRVKRSLLTA